MKCVPKKQVRFDSFHDIIIIPHKDEYRQYHPFLWYSRFEIHMFTVLDNYRRLDLLPP